jgi:hypothetical protein
MPRDPVPLKYQEAISAVVTERSTHTGRDSVPVSRTAASREARTVLSFLRFLPSFPSSLSPTSFLLSSSCSSFDSLPAPFRLPYPPRAQSICAGGLQSWPTPVFFNLGYAYPSGTRRPLRGYTKTSYGVCKNEKNK